jgi:hypothetical protein
MTTMPADVPARLIDPLFITATQLLRQLDPARQIMCLYAAAAWSDARLAEAMTELYGSAVVPVGELAADVIVLAAKGRLQ